MSDIERSQAMYDDLSRLGVQSGSAAARRSLVDKALMRGVLEEWPLVLSDIDQTTPAEHRGGAAWKACTDDETWADRVYCTRLRSGAGPHGPSPQVRPLAHPDECFDPTGGITGLMARDGLTFREALRSWVGRGR